MKYRTECFSGEGIRDAAAIMAYETFELGNSDVYCTLKAGILKGHPLLEEFSELMDEADRGLADDMTEEDKVQFFQRVLDAVEEVTGKKVRYAIWLADKANAYRYLMAGEDITAFEQTFTEEDIPDDCEGIDAYEEADAVILSQLEEDGALYGFEHYPTPITA